MGVVAVVAAVVEQLIATTEGDLRRLDGDRDEDEDDELLFRLVTISKCMDGLLLGLDRGELPPLVLSVLSLLPTILLSLALLLRLGMVIFDLVIFYLNLQ